MANVGAGGPQRRSTRIERGQILVVTGLLLAITFIGIAVVVNSAIYSENLAARDTGSENSEAQKTHAWVNESIARTMDRVNAHLVTNNPDTVNETLDDAVENQSKRLGDDAAQRGVVIDLDRADPQRGVRLRQTNSSRNFSNKNGKANWDLTNTVSESGQVTMQLSKQDIYSSTFDTTMSALADSAFGIEIHDEDYTGSGDGVWRVYFFQGASTNNVYAVVEEPDQNFTDLSDGTLLDHVVDGWLNQSCSTQGATVTVRLSDGRLGGTPCSQFGFYDGIGDHRIGITNAYTEDAFGNHVERGVGTYDVFLKGEVQNSGEFHTVGNGQPFWQSAVYSQNISITYQNRRTTYRYQNFTVRPKNYGRGGVLWAFPRIERFDVTRTNNDPPTFDVDWHVSHPQGNLDSVEVLLIDRTATTDVCLDLDLLCELTNTYNTNATVDSVTETVSGPSATGSTTVSHSTGFESINEYTVRFVVRDNQGRTRVANENFEVDT